MQLDIKRINKILLFLAILILVGGAVWCLFLNNAQRIVVAIGTGLALINLLGLSYFFNKNISRHK